MKASKVPEVGEQQNGVYAEPRQARFEEGLTGKMVETTKMDGWDHF